MPRSTEYGFSSNDFIQGVKRRLTPRPSLEQILATSLPPVLEEVISHEPPIAQPSQTTDAAAAQLWNAGYNKEAGHPMGPIAVALFEGKGKASEQKLLDNPDVNNNLVSELPGLIEIQENPVTHERELVSPPIVEIFKRKKQRERRMPNPQPSYAPGTE